MTHWMRLHFKETVSVSYNSIVMLSLCTGQVPRRLKGPVGLYELSFQYWFCLALQKGFLHGCQNGLVMETTEHGWSAGPRPQHREMWWNTTHSSASLEKFILVRPFVINTSSFLYTSQWCIAREPCLPLVWIPIDCAVSEESKCFPSTQCSIWWCHHYSHDCEVRPSYLYPQRASLEFGRTLWTAFLTYICWHICGSLSLYELLNSAETTNVHV